MPQQRKGRRRRTAGRLASGSIEVELSALGASAIGDLKSAWADRFSEEPPATRSRDLLVRLLAWRITAGSVPAAPDEIQLLLQAQQNLGQQSYQAVTSIADSDFAIGISARFLAQILQDLWIGEALPRRFDDDGKPDPGGPVSITLISLVVLDTGKLRLRVRTPIA